MFRSYSQVRQLRTCGWQYKLERLDRVPSRPSVPAVAGTAIHSGTEVIDQQLHAGNAEHGEILGKANARALNDIEVEVEAKREKGWEVETWKRYGRATKEKPQGENLEWFCEVGIPNALKAYLDWRVENDNFVLAEIPNFGLAIEVPFNFYAGGQLIHGWIDRVFTTAEGGYYPLDIKSGRKPETDEQLGLYSAALSKALGWGIQWGYYIYGLKSGKATLTPPIDVSHWDADKIEAVYGPATKLIDLGIFIPHPGEACFHCGVSDACDFARSVI